MMKIKVKYGIKCASPICGNNAGNDHVRYFSFPKDPARFAVWIKHCGLTVPVAIEKQKQYKLCGKYFERKMFFNDLCKRLRSNAVPTLFANNIPSITSSIDDCDVGSSVECDTSDILAGPLNWKTPENNVNKLKINPQRRQIRRRREIRTFDETKVILSRKNYNVLKEHSYSNCLKKKKKQDPCKKLTEIKPTENKANDSLPDWLKVDFNDSDYEDDNELKSLAQILKREHEYDLKNENQYNKHAHIPLNNDKISQSKSIKVIHTQKIQNENPELETKQNNIYYVLNIPTNPGEFIVQPPLNWVQLIYLAIKNSSMEYVSTFDVQHFSRRWFPYYLKNSLIQFIVSILKDYSETYFTCAYSIALSNHVMWTVNKEFVNTLEHMLISAVERNEDEIKSAMQYPNQLSTILKGYGVFQLGAENSNINVDFK